MGTVNMRVLITGGMGYLGGRLAQHLCKSGHSVFVGTRRAIDSPEWLPSAEMRQINWHDPDSLLRACEGVDAIVHAAGMNAQDCAAAPTAALEFNGVATARLVDAAIRAEVKQFLYLSTAHVYASPLAGKITEETCPRNPHPYATSHLAGENAVLFAAKQQGLNGLIVRLSNAIGPPANPSANCWMLLFNDLCLQAVRQKQLSLSSDGTAQRDFLPISDICSSLNYLISSPEYNVASKILNLGSEVSISIMESANKIAERCDAILGFRPKLIRQPTTNHLAIPVKIKYRCTRIKDLGVCLGNNINEEIDNTLIFCNENRDLIP